MKIEAWYSDNFESKLSGRYITLNHINPLLKKYKNDFDISILGTSELGKEIPLLKIGSGKKRILAWSQMHGNETTTTKSVFDFLKFLSQKELFQEEISNFLKNNTLYLVPILNPDGAASYTRINGNQVDLNRDAQDLSQKESKLLMNLFNSIQPALCLNLHGQRTIFGLKNGNLATISFLSPASNSEREITPSRKIAMSLIAKMNVDLQKYIPNQIGRYDDAFNDNCFGDAFQMKEAPVILFEAGHYKGDYQREKTREFIFYALLSVFGMNSSKEKTIDYKEYFEIPENKKNYKDFILRNVQIEKDSKMVAIAIQFEEVLKDKKIIFLPKISEIGDLKTLYAHKELDGKYAQVLMNSHENIEIGETVSIIVNKNDNSLIYFDENNFLF